MISRQHRWILRSEILLAWIVLLTILFYTYLELVAAPYIGFKFHSTSGLVEATYANLSAFDLTEGDEMIAVNGQNFKAWLGQLSGPLFPTALSAGDTVPLHFQREAVTHQVLWTVPGFTRDEFWGRVLNSWWLGLLFWLMGLVTLLLVRPLDSKRRLFAALFLVTSIWLTAGATSRWGLGESRIVYRVALLVSMPVLLHLHWLFPRSLSTLPRLGVWALYAVTALLAILQVSELIPTGASALIFGLALLGSLGLLVVHYVRQPDARAHVQLLFNALLFGFLPIVLLALASAFGLVPPWGTFGLFALPIIPGAYFYSIYRFQLGGSEFRANRLIAVYLFVIMLGTVIPIVAALLSGDRASTGSSVLWHTVAGVVVALIALYGFPHFQRLVERRLLAMPLPPLQLIETYLARITTTLNEASLIHLLKDEVLPSLLIRQSALLRIRNQEATSFYTTDTGTEVGLTPAMLADLVAHLNVQPVYRLPTSPDATAPTWVRLGLALQVEGKLIGLWLLGRHDPDDLYSPVEIATLQTLARQTALALANIEQSAQLQALYQASIERQELERMKMAHLLHDAILNQAAVLYMSLDSAALTPRVENAYVTLKGQIHQMVSNLRPPSLDLGLNAALEELAEELDQRAQSKFALRLTLQTSEVHYPSHIENHIFRIVQQACENAFRHARAQFIQISGTLAPDHVDLVVEDDGVGFVTGKPLDMTYLLANKHFGLVHMMERAEHIRAELALDSVPGHGTRVHLVWSGNERVGD